MTASEYQAVALQRQFIESLPQKAHQIEELWHRLRYFKWSDTAFQSFQQLVHRLWGSGSSFGLPAVSEAAQLLDNYLQDHQSLGQPIGGIEFEMIDQLVNMLCKVLNHPLDSDPLITHPLDRTKPTNGKLLFIVDSDHALSALLSAYLQLEGYQVKHFDTPGLCVHQLKFQTPHAILFDTNASGDLQQGFDGLAQIREFITKQTPILCISARADMDNRLKALRAGCASFLAKPLSPENVVNTVNNLLSHTGLRHKVLVVDDESSVAQYHTALLEQAGLDAHYVTQPMMCLQRVTELKPDLVVLDMHMPQVSGLELATLLRQDSQFLLLPLVFVTADTSIRLRKTIEGLGINEILSKPVDTEAFVAACERAINETASLKQRVEAITQRGRKNHQLTRSFFFAAVENELQEECPADETSAVYHLELDIQENFYDAFGATGVAQLHEQFCDRLAELVGTDEQWTDLANFTAVILAGRRQAELHKHRAEHLATQLSNHVFCVHEQVLIVNAHIGIQPAQGQARSVNSLMKLAEQAHRQAKAGSEFSHQPLPEPEINAVNPDQINAQFFEKIPEENLCVCYQPMISLEENHVEHYEALLRWRTDDEELIPAGKFLHYLDHSSIRIALDRWVLQASVNAIASDNYARENACLFVHLSEETLSQKSFFSFAANVLRSSRLRGQRRLIFIFEEPWVALHLRDAQELIHSLHNIQCGACLSHAGSTTESEEILDLVEFDYLRLSPSLTSKSSDENTSRIDRLVKLAQTLDITAIATQVEDPQNLSTLWLKGVRLFQGYLLQAPDQSLKSTSDVETIRQVFAAD